MNILLFVGMFLFTDYCDMQKGAFKYIVSDESINEFFGISTDQSVKFTISDKSIPYDLTSFYEAIVSETIEGYHLFGDYDEDEKKYIQYVYDSIQRVNVEAEKETIQHNGCKHRVNTKAELVVTFSSLYKNTIIAEVLQSKGLSLNHGHYGVARTYLFTFTKGKISNVKKGKVHYN